MAKGRGELMSKQWNRVSDKLLPQERRVVLLNINEHKEKGLPPCVAVGYMRRYSDGGYYFVTPGADVQKDREVMYWSDCLGDDFQCPLWANKQMNKTSERYNG